MNRMQLCDINTCTQCRACQSICPKQCISFVPGKDGFEVPEIDRDICIECGTCMRACHKITPALDFRVPLKNYACWTRSIADREKSSSGGAFSVIARKVIADEGIVFGSTMGRDLQVRHIAIEKVDDIPLLQGSKYVQSDLTGIYPTVREALLFNREVLFTGTPCQVAGLRTFLKRDYENLFTCDIVCHGVPSQVAFNEYIERIGLNGRAGNFSFRFTKGWGYQLACQLIAPTKSGLSARKIIRPDKAYFLRAFSKGLMFSEACYTCPYARPERVSDFTLADYWGLGETMPFSHPTHKGISCMLINSDKGLNLISQYPDLEYEERPLEEAIKGNHNLSHVSNRPQGRETYFEDSKKMPLKQLVHKYDIQASLRDYLRLLKQGINSLR